MGDGPSPTYAAAMIGKLREHIETGQLNIGAGGPGSNNGIVNPLRQPPQLPQPQPRAPEDPNNPNNPDGKNHDGKTKAAENLLVKGGVSVGVVQSVAPVSPRTAHAEAARAHAEVRRKKRALEDARHKKEREDKLTRYLALIICIVVIIFALLAMAAISRRVIGKWWHGQPDPLESPPSDKIQHSPLFPAARG